MSAVPPIVVGITGASGAPYAVRLLQQLVAAHRPVSLIVSKYGMRLLETESGIGSVDALRDTIGKHDWDSCIQTFSNEDRGAPPASGSALTAGMIVCPCSMGTVAAIAGGTSRSLVEAVPGAVTVVDSGVITTSSTQPLEARLNAIYRAVHQLIETQKPTFLVVEDLFQKILDVVNLIRHEPKDLLKSPVFLARELPEQDVVEQQLRHHRRHHDVDLAPGQMHENALELADFACHVEPHATGILPLE